MLFCLSHAHAKVKSRPLPQSSHIAKTLQKGNIFLLQRVQRKGRVESVSEKFTDKQIKNRGLGSDLIVGKGAREAKTEHRRKGVRHVLLQPWHSAQ